MDTDRFDRSSLVEEAMARTGEEGFGEPGWQEGLDLLLDGLLFLGGSETEFAAGRLDAMRCGGLFGLVFLNFFDSLENGLLCCYFVLVDFDGRDRFGAWRGLRSDRRYDRLGRFEVGCICFGFVQRNGFLSNGYAGFDPRLRNRLRLCESGLAIARWRR